MLVIASSVCVQIAEAQNKKLPRVGWLSLGRGPTPPVAFIEGLRKLGWYVGENIAIEGRFARERRDDLARLAAELLQLKVDVIVAASSPALPVAKNATRTIPIIMTTNSDPVESGYVASFARPGGNITGLTTNHGSFNAKRLEIFKQAVPRLSRLAVFDPRSRGDWGTIKRAGKGLGIQLDRLHWSHPDALKSLFKATALQRPDGLMVIAGPETNAHRREFIAFASRNRLPAMYPLPIYAADGGLMSFGPNLDVIYRRAAYYVDRILKGAKPSDLPVERPLRAEFVVNLKAAKEIGLMISPEVLQRADIVIR
jgi:putative ABC transport system substrate-binding protein